MSLFSAIAELIKPAPPPDPEVAAALDRVIGMTVNKDLDDDHVLTWDDLVTS